MLILSRPIWSIGSHGRLPNVCLLSSCLENNIMEVHSDFEELLELFNKNEVEYLVVGAFALAHHGVPRYTGDMDLLVRPHSENSAKIMAALEAFGFGSLELSEADFCVLGRVIQLGVAPVRIDLVTSITGVTWEEAIVNGEEGRLGETPVLFLGRDAFIANKRAVGRHKDLADIEALGGETKST